MELIIYSPQNGEAQEIKFNYDDLKNQLSQQLDKYQNIIVTEDSIRDGKSTRATLNKLKTALDDKRKEIKKQCLKPYEDFETKVNELISMIDKPISNIDNQVKIYETKVKNAKKDEIYKYYESVNIFGNLITLDHPCMWNEKYLNVTFKLDEIKKEIDEKIELVKTGLENIDVNLNTEFKAQVRDVFLKTFDLNKTLAENNRLTEQKKKEEFFNQKKQELQNKLAEVNRQEQQTPTTEPIEPIQHTPTETVEPTTIKKYKLSFEIEATEEQIKKLSTFLKDNNYTYKKL